MIYCGLRQQLNEIYHNNNNGNSLTTIRLKLNSGILKQIIALHLFSVYISLNQSKFE